MMVQHQPGIFSVALDGDVLPRVVVLGHNGGGRCSKLEKPFCARHECAHVAACQAPASCEDLSKIAETRTTCTRPFPVWRGHTVKTGRSMSRLPLATAQQYNTRQQQQAYGGGSQKQTLQVRINGGFPAVLMPEVDGPDDVCKDCQEGGVNSPWKNGIPTNMGDAVIHTVKGNHHSINLIGLKCINCDNMLVPDGRSEALFIKE